MKVTISRSNTSTRSVYSLREISQNSGIYQVLNSDNLSKYTLVSFVSKTTNYSSIILIFDIHGECVNTINNMKLNVDNCGWNDWNYIKADRSITINYC